MRSSLLLQPLAGDRVEGGERLVQSRIAGSLASARAMAHRCCMPPESSYGGAVRDVGRPTSSSCSSAIAAARPGRRRAASGRTRRCRARRARGTGRRCWKTTPRSARARRPARRRRGSARRRLGEAGDQPQQRASCRTRTGRRPPRTRPARCRRSIRPERSDVAPARGRCWRRRRASPGRRRATRPPSARRGGRHFRLGERRGEDAVDAALERRGVGHARPAAAWPFRNSAALCRFSASAPGASGVPR